MRILRRKLSKEEAILVCERIKLVAIIKPRLYEILDLECDPKDNPRAQRLFGELLRGNLVLVHDSQRKITAWDPQNFPPFELIPLDSTDFEIHWINRENKKRQKLRGDVLPQQRPALNIEVDTNIARFRVKDIAAILQQEDHTILNVLPGDIVNDNSTQYMEAFRTHSS